MKVLDWESENEMLLSCKIKRATWLKFDKGFAIFAICTLFKTSIDICTPKQKNCAPYEHGP